MSAYCNYCETCTGVCGGWDQGSGPCVFEERDTLRAAMPRLLRLERFVTDIASLRHASDCWPCTDVKCNLARQAEELLKETP